MDIQKEAEQLRQDILAHKEIYDRGLIDDVEYFKKANESILQYTEKICREQEGVLDKAIEIIRTWHNADEVWDIYYNKSPEMKEIREWKLLTDSSAICGDNK